MCEGKVRTRVIFFIEGVKDTKKEALRLLWFLKCPRNKYRKQCR